MITIYDAREVNFNNNGLCVLDNIVKSAKITEELNGQYVLDIELTKDNTGKYKYLEEFSIIKAGGQLFRLYNLNNLQDKLITIKASLEHISKDINTDFIEDNRAENTTVDEALRKVVLDSRFTILPTNMPNLNTAYFVKDKPLETIFKTILPRWGGELKRDNFNIGIVSKIGRDTGISIEYAKNIVGFEQTLDSSNIITRMMPTGQDGCTIDLVNGGSKWLESPRINNYYKTFSGEVKFDKIEDATELKNTAEKLWGSIDLPKTNYKVNFIELQKTKEYKKLYKNIESLNLGDSVIIKHKIFNVNLTARVIRIVKDALTNKILEIELGQFKDNIFNKFNDIDYKIEDTATSLEEAKKDLQTKITQTDEKIVLEATRLDGEIEETRAELEITAGQIRAEVTDVENSLQSQLNVQAGLISSKVTASDVSSIIRQSPTDVQYAFNGITPTVVINASGITINDGSFNGGQININNGNGALFAGKSGKIIIRSVDLIGADFSSGVDFSNASFVSGLEKFGYATQLWVMNNFALKTHSHSEFSAINNEFTNVGNALNNIYIRLAALEAK